MYQEEPSPQRNQEPGMRLCSTAFSCLHTEPQLWASSHGEHACALADIRPRMLGEQARAGTRQSHIMLRSLVACNARYTCKQGVFPGSSGATGPASTRARLRKWPRATGSAASRVSSHLPECIRQPPPVQADFSRHVPRPHYLVQKLHEHTLDHTESSLASLGAHSQIEGVAWVHVPKQKVWPGT